MHGSIKDVKILEFETELYVAHKQGYIFRYVHTTELDTLSSKEKILGVEILFSDVVTPKQVSKIQTYILKNYGFEVDDTLCDDVNILIVRYL
jgi:hypothetical protein